MKIERIAQIQGAANASVPDYGPGENPAVSGWNMPHDGVAQPFSVTRAADDPDTYSGLAAAPCPVPSTRYRRHVHAAAVLQRSFSPINPAIWPDTAAKLFQ